MKYSTIEAYLWGRSVGEVRKFSGIPMGSAKGTGLRKGLRDHFENGLRNGYNKPRATTTQP